MINEWSLRNEILTASHRWPVILLFCLAGSLAGLVVSLIWPTPYRASHDLYVALNIYRWELDGNAVRFADNVQFNNPDDYKNWQMANLNALVLRQDVAQATLDRLRTQDPYWEQVPLEDLIPMLNVYWRNAGRWRLAAQHSQANRAAQAVTAWKDVVLEQLSAAIAASQRLIVIESQIQAATREQAEAAARLAELQQTRLALQPLQEDLQADEPLDEAEHRQAVSLVSGVGVGDPAWEPLLRSTPLPQASTGEHAAWLQAAITLIEESVGKAQARLQAFEQQLRELNVAYSQASTGSRGFSANMEVAPMDDFPAQRKALRPTALLALIGAALGLLAWTALWLGRIALKAQA